MPLQVIIQSSGKKACRVALVGRLDGDTCSELESRLGEITQSDSVLLDLSGLEYLSSQGLRVLLNLRKALEKKKARLGAVGTRPAVARVLDFANILPRMEMFDSEAAADAFLNAVQQRENLRQLDLDD